MELRFTMIRFLSAIAIALLSQSAFATTPISQKVNDPGAREARFWMDVNNDGRDDFCYFSGEGWQTKMYCHMASGNQISETPKVFPDIGPIDPAKVRWMDQNGDGAIDLCKMEDKDGGVVVTCRYGPNFNLDSNFPVSPIHTGVKSDHLFVADFNLDGFSDYCLAYYPKDGDGFHFPFGFRLKCVMASVGYFTEVPAWVYNSELMSGDIKGLLSKAGFHDVNGDGWPDFCFVKDNKIRCLLGTKNGPFQGGEWISNDLGPDSQTDGAAFVDINGDGLTDYCRPVGRDSPFSRLFCRLSTGTGFSELDTGTNFLDAGWPSFRSWTDINGDGIPDYCRATHGSGDPGHAETYNSTNHLSCRLGSGDAALFVPSDITVENIGFGVADGTRGFCDPYGSGVATFCRMEVSQILVVDDGAECHEQDGQIICPNKFINQYHLKIGVQDEGVKRSSHVMTKVNDGIGAEVRIGYAPMTSTSVYYRSGYGLPVTVRDRFASQIVQPKDLAVFETRAWSEQDNRRLTGNARYYYKDLRQNRILGSQGFAERWMLTEGSNSIEHHQYFQGVGDTPDSLKGDYREVGQIRNKRKFVMTGTLPGTVPGSSMGTVFGTMLNRIASVSNPDALGDGYLLVERTSNELSESAPEQNPRFRYIGKTVTEQWDMNDGQRIEMPKRTVTSSIDHYGNVRRLEEVTEHPTNPALKWTRTTVNTYGQDNWSTWTLGRLTRSQVTSTAPTPEQQLAMYPRSIGNSPNAASTSSNAPPVNQPGAPNQLSPAVLSAILQLLLED